MEKENSLKRFSIAHKIGLLVFAFSLLSSPLSYAANTGLNWENPNKNGDNPYKLTADAILNPQTLTRVIGCTGLVNGVSAAVTNLLGKGKLNFLDYATEKLVLEKEKMLEKACLAVKGGTESGLANIIMTTYTQAVSDGFKCPEINKTELSAEDKAANKKMLTQMVNTEKREACFNGLAYTLAKNQLTSMTRQTINWVNSGFGGNPLYVQNIRSLTNSIEKNVIETGIQVLSDGVFPYSGNFTKTLIQDYNHKTERSALGAFDSLASDLSLFFTDKDSYGLGNTNSTLSAKERAIRDVDRFTNDFAVGGWDGYLALTQRDQNNPLGFTMKATQYLADRIDQQSNETKDEITQNNGFLSQKECTLWEVRDINGPITITKGITSLSGNVTLTTDSNYKHSTSKTSEYDKCIDWKVITPGSIVKEKLSTYINSPERQLELADDINSVLNNLFTKLIENFRSEGLFGLSQEKYSAVDDLIGYGANGVGVSYIEGDTIGYSTPSYLGGEYQSSSKSFDLLRDLGNTYIHDSVEKIGTWDAKNNIALSNNQSYFYLNNGDTTKKLSVDRGVITEKKYNDQTKSYDYPYKSDYYYLTVTNQGNTKLFNNGYNSWAVGDRAFWNKDEGKWQNWKAGEQSPIKKRGIIQIQKDYSIGAREILKVLPNIMPKIGKLDYCIPGPNPSFEANSRSTYSAFLDFVNSISGTYGSGTFFSANETTYEFEKPGKTYYDAYFGIFKDVGSITSTSIFKDLYTLESTYKHNPDEERQNTIIQDKISKVTKDVSNFYTNYQQRIKSEYYDKMTKPYEETENSAEQKKNTAYVPMIQDGYNVTKDMVSRDEQLKEDMETYKNEISIAESNVVKLNMIKAEVDKIINKAQARRNEKIKSVVIPMMKEKYKGTHPNMTDGEAFYRYKTHYQSCFDEEYIDYIDYGNISAGAGNEKERCFDGLDNDLDGLVDKKDKDCTGVEQAGKTLNTTITGDCDDGIDNDNDGKIDSNDNSCRESIFEAYRETIRTLE